METMDQEQPIVREQIQAAYALNLCAVSVSQIIDYDDTTILEQEYETILNNLNLEYMPKDEALLDILKQLLETITFFRIQEGDKKFVEKEYQQKIKNAIWSAVPNLGLLVAGGSPVTMAISLASQVGIGYMNYRKNRSEYQLDREKQMWQLQRSAIEQFEALQQQLFETAWRLADKYSFPDAFRLTERQIKQYDAILMDTDEVRKYERLDAVKNRFAAYPPFWYYFGNTANAIANSEHYGLDNNGKNEFREKAKKYFEYFQGSNKYNLLREDSITAACNLEYIDLLDVKKDKEKIYKLIADAVRAAGNSLDVLQLCAVAYIKIGCVNEASDILRQLVNEEYNTVTNAQLLSAIYVDRYINLQSSRARNDYRLLQTRVSTEYLFPMPDNVVSIKQEELQEQFVKMQQGILKTKYKLVLMTFVNKYEILINRIVPLPDDIHPDDIHKETIDHIYLNRSSSKAERMKRVQLTMADIIKSEEYKFAVRNISYSYQIIDILNRMFGAVCILECVQDEHKQLELADLVKKALHENRNEIQDVERNLTDFSVLGYEKTQAITLRKLAKEFLVAMVKEINESVDSKIEMKDFAIAEVNLARFCELEGLTEPEMLYVQKDDAEMEVSRATYFTPDLLGEDAIKQNERIKKNMAMINCIKNNVESVVANNDLVEFYTHEDPRMGRYFSSKELQKHIGIRVKTLAVLDDRSKHDYDLLFTSEGIMPIIKGRVKSVIPYNKIECSNNDKKKELVIGVRYENEKLDMDALYNLIQKLKPYAAKIEKTFL